MFDLRPLLPIIIRDLVLKLSYVFGLIADIYLIWLTINQAEMIKLEKICLIVLILSATFLVFYLLTWWLNLEKDLKIYRNSQPSTKEP